MDEAFSVSNESKEESENTAQDSNQKVDIADVQFPEVDSVLLAKPVETGLFADLLLKCL